MKPLKLAFAGEYYKADEVEAERELWTAELDRKEAKVEKLESALYSMQDKVKAQQAEIDRLKGGRDRLITVQEELIEENKTQQAEIARLRKLVYR